MKLLLLGLTLLGSVAFGQKQVGLPRLSYQVSIDFQGFKLPFSKTAAYFGNPGFSAGVVYDWNRSTSFQQVFRAGTFFNRYHGRSWYVSTAAQYNPFKQQTITPAISLGLGYLVAGSGNQSFQPGGDGHWQKTKGGRGMLMVPLGVQLSIKAADNNRFSWRPTIGYQLPVMIGYNPSVPVLPASLIQIGSTFKIK